MTRIFIGSTSTDLEDYREAVIKLCYRHEVIPIHMENFPPDPGDAIDLCLREVDRSDIYLGIFAHRYGYIPDDPDKNPGAISITEMEYRRALENKLPVYIWMVDDDAPWSPKFIDMGEKNEKLNRLKSEIKNKHVIRVFSDLDGFREDVAVNLPKIKPAATTAQSVANTAVLRLPPRPDLIVGREHNIDVIKDRIGIHPGSTPNDLTMIWGWPGQGKSTLVEELVNLPDVQAAFPDGILFTTLGPDPELIATLGEWGDLLSAPTVKRRKGWEDARTELASLLHGKKLLLVVDDVWKIDDGEAFHIKVDNCPILMTTRHRGVMIGLTQEMRQRYELPGLSSDDGVALLARLTPDTVKRFPDECANLVDTLEGLPLSLRIAGGLIEKNVQAGFDSSEDMQELFTRIKERIQDMAVPTGWSGADRSATVYQMLKVAVEALPVEVKQCFAYLGAFPAEPATFEFEDMAVLWGLDPTDPEQRTEAQETVAMLVDRGLIRYRRDKRDYYMHGLLADFAGRLLEDLDE